MGKEIKEVYVDADHILYELASPPSKAMTSTLQGTKLNKPNVKAEVKRLKGVFMGRIELYLSMAQVESVGNKWDVGEVHPVISSASNFRYDIFPDYKKGRKETARTEAFLKLRKWARKKYARDNVEADDVVAHYVRAGAIGFSGDKDLLKGVAGIWFDTFHMRKHWVYTSKKSAKRFTLTQYVMGDLGDGIPGIPNVGIVNAERLLDKHGWNWAGVSLSYIEKGLSVYDAILTRRLISMKQWCPDKGLQLFGKEK